MSEPHRPVPPKPRRPERKRLDVRCVELGLAKSREQAQALILAGEIYVDDAPATKAGLSVADNATIAHRGSGQRYVSRGGLKLEAALATFTIDPAGIVAFDVGASTGGFTDCLLQHGARHVIALDVGSAQLDWKLRQDARVTAIEQTNIRYVTLADLLPLLPDPTFWPPQLTTIDVSFISLTLVLPVLADLLPPAHPILALVKPQFEAGRNQVGKGGVVRDEAVRRAVIAQVRQFVEDRNFVVQGEIDAPIRGPKGNLEHWLYLKTAAPVPAHELARP